MVQNSLVNSNRSDSTRTDIINGFESKQSERAVGAEIAVTRQAQEVQAAMVVAKRFPRDENAAFTRIIKACERRSLAEQGMYEYPRGGTKVTGASIRLAESVAQNWGNIDFGIIELEQKQGESTVMAYAWDLETNTRSTTIFNVPHVRDTKSGGKELTESRDIYEIVANMGARRKRACIMAVIPGDVFDAAVEQCKETLTKGNKKPLVDRVRDMIVVFDREFQINQEMLEKYIGCKSTAFSENDFIRLKSMYRSLRDGMATREQYFSGDSSVEHPDAQETQPQEQPESSQEPQAEDDPLA